MYPHAWQVVGPILQECCLFCCSATANISRFAVGCVLLVIAWLVLQCCKGDMHAYDLLQLLLQCACAWICLDVKCRSKHSFFWRIWHDQLSTVRAS
jgi:hypothetical protein